MVVNQTDAGSFVTIQCGHDKIHIPKLLYASSQQGRAANLPHVPDIRGRDQVAWRFCREQASDEFGRCREPGLSNREGECVATHVNIKRASKGFAGALILCRCAQSRLIGPVTECIEEAHRVAMANEPYPDVANPHKLGYHAYAR
jgi:hypothetical protein